MYCSGKHKPTSKGRWDVKNSMRRIFMPLKIQKETIKNIISNIEKVFELEI